MSAYRSYSVKPPPLELTKRRSTTKFSDAMLALSIVVFFIPAIIAIIMSIITYQPSGKRTGGVLLKSQINRY